VEQAKAAAGDGSVGVGGANVAQQCLDARLLDEVRVNLVPVLLGSGIRFFDNLSNTPVALEGPRVIEGKGVTHLIFRVGPPSVRADADVSEERGKHAGDDRDEVTRPELGRKA
jgi:RibD C-terminal domain